jgi:hypothetical protein
MSGGDLIRAATSERVITMYIDDIEYLDGWQERELDDTAINLLINDFSEMTIAEIDAEIEPLLDDVTPIDAIVQRAEQIVQTALAQMPILKAFQLRKLTETSALVAAE